jgi:hypothetical protein
MAKQSYKAREHERLNPNPQERRLRSTRWFTQKQDEDAWSDMDGFDEIEELARLRYALRHHADFRRSAKFIRRAFNNLDEHLTRDGRAPRPWSEAKAAPKKGRGCTYEARANERDNPKPRERVLRTTRTGSEGFDGFDVNEELARIRCALRDPSAAASRFLRATIDNLDAYLTAGGQMPRAWPEVLA